MSVIKINKWLFEKINKTPTDQLFQAEFCEVFNVMEHIASEQDVAWILDYNGPRKVIREQFQSITDQLPAKYVKQMAGYPSILFLNGIYEDGRFKSLL